jgi:hypothetical protein
MAVIYPDRVITIQGSVDNMAAAQASISAKLAECVDKDMQANANGVSIQLCSCNVLPAVLLTIGHFF